MTVDNTQEVIDSRDVIARLDELTPWRVMRREDGSDIAEFTTEVEARSFVSDEDYDPEKVYVGPSIAMLNEQRDLKRLAEQGEASADWKYGETLIRFDHFEQYCEEMVRDIGYIPKDLPAFIADNIDWEGVANVLAGDYTEVDFAGVTYLIRS